jgi:hypothetical protein
MTQTVVGGRVLKNHILRRYQKPLGERRTARPRTGLRNASAIVAAIVSMPENPTRQDRATIRLASYNFEANHVSPES